MKPRVEQAVELYETGGLNCSQAMLSVYGEGRGLDKPTAVKVASVLGAGMGRLGNTCGAVTGAFLALGLSCQLDDPQARDKVYALVRDFAKRFESRNGSISCSLLGNDFGTEAGAAKIKEQKLTSLLYPKFVKDAAEIMEEMLDEHR
mgnify:CR=1 FL=1